MKRNILGYTMMVFLVFILLSCANTERTITVAGTGTVTFIPDLAIITITIKNINSTLNESLQQTKQTVVNINNVCKAFNIDKNDVKTSYINTDKEYEGDYNKKTFIGYSASENLKITFRQLEKFELFTEQILALKITSIDDITFNHSKFSDFSSEADMVALDDAKKSAEKIANRMNVKLGRIKYITNVNSNEGSYLNQNYSGRAFSKSLTNGIVASPGILSTTNIVNIVYYIE